MAAFSTARVGRVAAGAVVAVLAWGHFAPTAPASCGDYVTVMPSHTPHVPSPFDPVQTPVSFAPDSPFPCPCREPQPFGRLPKPCDGPMCQAPASPATAAVPVPVERSDNWAALFVTVGMSAIPSLVDTLENSCNHLFSNALWVFRPPRPFTPIS